MKKESLLIDVVAHCFFNKTNYATFLPALIFVFPIYAILSIFMGFGFIEEIRFPVVIVFFWTYFESADNEKINYAYVHKVFLFNPLLLLYFAITLLLFL